MAERNQSKAERRQALEHLSKAERKEAKLRRKQLRRAAEQETAPQSAGPQETGPAGSAASASGDALEVRLARLEETVSAQAELSRQLLEKLDEVLEATHAEDPQP